MFFLNVFMTVAALFIMAKRSKQPKCPNEWINHGPSMQWKIIQPIKRNKTRTHATLVYSENILLRERSQTQSSHIV